MAVIFGFSRQSGIESGGLSAKVVQIILSIFNMNVDNTTFGVLEHIIRKLAHATEYAMLAILVFNALHNITKNIKKVATISFLIAALYSLIDESHQLFVQGRVGSIKDCFIDSTGALLGVIFCLVVLRLLSKNKNYTI